MTQWIRDIAVGASGRLVVGLCAGLFLSLNAGTAPAQSVGGAVDLAHVPSNASIVAYANVREVMLSDVWARIRPLLADGLGQDQLEQQRGSTSNGTSTTCWRSSHRGPPRGDQPGWRCCVGGLT